MSPEVLSFESVDNKIMIHEEGDGESTFIAKIRVSPRKGILLSNNLFNFLDMFMYA